MFDQILNPNNTYTNRNADNIYRSNIGVKQGIVINVGRENHLAQTYDVRDLETGALFLGCKYQSPTGGFNGVGRYAPLDEGTLVTYTCAEGIGEHGIITGTLYTEGNYNKYYSEGKLQEFAQLEEYGNKLYEISQPSGHPNRITDPGATAIFYGTNNLFDTFSDTRFTDNIEDKAKANRQPGIIDLATSVGDKINYAFNSIINYTANIINVAEGTAESKCAKLIEYANYYSKQADLLAQTSIINETTKEEAKKTTGIKPIVSKQSNAKSSSSLKSPFTDQYFIEQYRKLSQTYLEQAQACNRGDTARQLVGLQMQATLGSELPQGEQAVEGQQTKPDYKPKESKIPVNKNTIRQNTNIYLSELDKAKNRLISIARKEGEKEYKFTPPNYEADKYLEPLRKAMLSKGFPNPKNERRFKYDWCGAFVLYCCRQAGFTIPDSPSSKSYATFAWVKSWKDWAVSYNMWKINSPKPGDIIVYDWIKTTGEYNHIGIILEVYSDYLITSEGNTGHPNSRTLIQKRNLNEVQGYIELNRLSYV